MFFRYDFHNHSCLSPCGDNDMTPCNIVGMAKILNLDIEEKADGKNLSIEKEKEGLELSHVGDKKALEVSYEGRNGKNE